MSDGMNASGLKADLERFGFVGLPAPALAPELHDEILEEARRQRAAAWANVATDTFDQKLMRAEIGPMGLAFLQRLGQPLTEGLLGQALEISRDSTCYTYYDEAESRLGVHLDRDDSCAATVILYLEAVHPPGAAPSSGLTLEVFGPTWTKGDAPIHVIPTRANSLAVGRGSQVWHGRPSLAAGEKVIALTACFHRAQAARPDAQAARATLLAEGMAAWGRGDLAGAEGRFRRLLAMDEADAEGWAGLGRVAWSAGDFEAARIAFKAAADLEGDNPAHWSNLGLAHRDLKQPAQAVAAFRAALALNPAHAPAVNEWANVLQDQGLWAEALPMYEQALALDDGRAVVHHNIGVCWLRLGHDQMAADCFTEALALDPSYAHSLEEMGALYLKYGDRARAQGVLSRAGTGRAGAIWSAGA